MDQVMLWGMLIMAIAAWLYTIAAALIRVRSIILESERQTEWVANILEHK
jgi:heme exporter protein C